MLKKFFGSGGAKAEEKLDPKEQSREWSRKLRTEMRGLDRQINQIEREKQKVIREIQVAAKKNEVSSVKILAKEVVRSSKAQNRLLETKVQLNSVSMQLQHMTASMRVSGSIGRSTDVMKSMSKLINVKEISDSMQEMSREMAKMGLIDDMVSDAMDSMDAAGIEDETEEEVAKVLHEHAADVLASMPEASRKQLPQLASEKKKQEVAASGEVDDALMQRLAGL